MVRSWAAATVEMQGSVVAAAGETIATAGEDHLIHLWRRSGQETVRWSAHSAEVTALAFDPRGRVLYSGAEDGSLRVWDLERIRTEVRKFGLGW